MRAARIDANQPEIVRALRKAGCSVQPLHTVGGGVPDLLVCIPGLNHPSAKSGLYLLEIKDGAKPPSARQLTPDQKAWHRDWCGPVHVVESIEAALAAVGME